MSGSEEYIKSIHNAMRTDPRLRKLQGYPELYTTYQNLLKYLLKDMVEHPDYCYLLLKIWVSSQKLCDEVITYLSANAAAKPNCFKEVLNAAYKLFMDLIWYAEIWFKNPRTDDEKLRKRRNSV